MPCHVCCRYGGPKFRFGCLDATLWPAFCKETLKVTASVWTAALPAVVLYSKGKEVGRLPRPEDIDEIGLKRNHFTKVGGMCKGSSNGISVCVCVWGGGGGGGLSVYYRWCKECAGLVEAGLTKLCDLQQGLLLKHVY
jgi:hypothetical protein